MMVVEAATAAADSVSPMAVGAGGGCVSLHNFRLSTVVPGSVTGEAVDYELTDADLLHKLHYLRAVHVFRAPAPGAAAALNVRELKEPMFPWLDMYFPVSGRVRRHQAADGDNAEGAKEDAAAGRPYVRCNDCGVRIVEATCDATVDEWLEAEAERGGLCKVLAYDKVIGPELFFSPLLYVQFSWNKKVTVGTNSKRHVIEQVTSFKCGGMAFGFTWAHLIGDMPSAAACFSTWAQLFSGKKVPPPTLRDPLTRPPSAAPGSMMLPPSVKATAAAVGDHWVVPTARDMVSFSFHVTEQQLKGLQLTAPASGRHQVGTFELVAALVWRALAAIRSTEEEEATRTVTVVKTTDPVPAPGGGRLGLTNEHRIGHVVATGGSSPAAADVAKLAALLAGARLDEAGAVAAAALAGPEDADVVVYGANLTFVDAEGLDVYGLELGAWRPAHVEYAVDGVGDGGSVVVHRDAGGRGRTVAAVVRRGEADRLRAALREALRVA
ncbi:Protein ECERIFERUM 26-like [Dichanthelium oligosanthes]|uniref:Protein ECERIFERUM 26-like n=1 Tax=Dichanthelium oligosanthes TaxID=888268 RepID=A0A1E5WLA4_9POAL|nr:Protein ECERIFERUM 26-like [Dichanthelium oligosanthes]